MSASLQPRPNCTLIRRGDMSTGYSDPSTLTCDPSIAVRRAMVRWHWDQVSVRRLALGSDRRPHQRQQGCQDQRKDRRRRIYSHQRREYQRSTRHADRDDTADAVGTAIESGSANRQPKVLPTIGEEKQFWIKTSNGETMLSRPVAALVPELASG